MNNKEDKILSGAVPPFSVLSLCRCPGSRAQPGWRGSLPHSPCETRPHAGAEGTGRLLRSRGWRRGSVLMCTGTKATRNEAPVTSRTPSRAPGTAVIPASVLGKHRQQERLKPGTAADVKPGECEVYL